MAQKKGTRRICDSVATCSSFLHVPIGIPHPWHCLLMSGSPLPYTISSDADLFSRGARELKIRNGYDGVRHRTCSSPRLA